MGGEADVDHRPLCQLLDTSGELCLECGRSEDALNLFRRSIELAPNSGASKYMNMAQLLESHDSLAVRGSLLLPSPLPPLRPLHPMHFGQQLQDNANQQASPSCDAEALLLTFLPACRCDLCTLQHYNKGIELLMAELEVQKDSPEAVKLIRSQLATAYVSMTEIFMTVACNIPPFPSPSPDQRASNPSPISRPGDLFLQDLCEEEGAEAKCEELLGLALQHGPDSPEVYGQLASFRRGRPTSAPNLCTLPLSNARTPPIYPFPPQDGPRERQPTKAAGSWLRFPSHHMAGYASINRRRRKRRHTRQLGSATD
jgi:hypothetical protein